MHKYMDSLLPHSPMRWAQRGHVAKKNKNKNKNKKTKQKKTQKKKQWAKNTAILVAYFPCVQLLLTIVCPPLDAIFFAPFFFPAFFSALNFFFPLLEGATLCDFL